jgi:hypothetical protein
MGMVREGVDIPDRVEEAGHGEVGWAVRDLDLDLEDTDTGWQGFGTAFGAGAED